MRTVCVKLPEDLERALTKLVKQRRTTRSAVVREAIEAYTRVPKRPLSFTEAAGDLVGCVRGGPRDLSTNPKHMEGFGRDARR